MGRIVVKQEHQIFLTRSIALGELVGGFIGLLTLGEAAARYSELRLASVLAPLSAACVTTLIAGIGLLRGKRYGLVLSSIVQVCEMIQVASVRGAFGFVAGPSVLIGIVRDHMFVTAGVSANLALSFSPDQTRVPTISVNALAMITAAYLWVRWRAVLRAPPAMAESHSSTSATPS